MKIFCIPGGGTPSSVFFKWKAMMKKEAEIVILDYPGRDILEKQHRFYSVYEIAEYLFAQMKNVLKDCDRYYLLSSCTGCMIAYELYRLIEKHSLKLPEKFIAFSSFSPDTSHYAEKAYLSKENEVHISNIYESLFSNELFSSPESCSRTCSHFLIESYQNKAGSKFRFPSMDILPESETYEKKSMLEFANRTISMILYDWDIASKYAQEESEFTKINADIYVIRGCNDNIVSEKSAMEWRNFTDRNFMYKTIDGNHNLITSNADTCIALIKSLI